MGGRRWNENGRNIRDLGKVKILYIFRGDGPVGWEAVEGRCTRGGVAEVFRAPTASVLVTALLLSYSGVL